MGRRFFVFSLVLLFGAISELSARETIIGQAAGSQNVFAATSPKITLSRTQSTGSDPCKIEYWACMDAFCMPSNTNGGRCACSNESIKLDKEYAALSNEKTVLSNEYAAAANEEAALSNENLDLKPEDCESDDISCKVGAAKYSLASKLCETKTSPECKANFSFTKLQYSQNIRNDCAAYQLAVKDAKEKIEAISAASKKQALKNAIAEFEASNKYNESECLLEFKKCMNTSEVCGIDWSRCKISGILEKRYLCEKILDNCTIVKESVWNGFISEITPTLKSFELDAEDVLRQNCLARISDCITKACTDNITGLGETMDGCLARPEMVQSFCKIEMDECDIDGNLWAFTKQKLAAMRTDKCTLEVKDCLTSENACGPRFSGCIGIDLDRLKKICPSQKLVVCKQSNPIFSIYDTEQIIEGIFLSMDNELLLLCGELRDQKMIEVCGSLSNCDKQFKDNSIDAEAVIAMIETDPKISWCIGGRDMSEISKTIGKTAARFPNLTVAIRSVIEASNIEE